MHSVPTAALLLSFGLMAFCLVVVIAVLLWVARSLSKEAADKEEKIGLAIELLCMGDDEARRALCALTWPSSRAICLDCRSAWDKPCFLVPTLPAPPRRHEEPPVIMQTSAGEGERFS